MSSGPADDGARDLVFVSYSRDDAKWAQRIQVLLAPLLRNRRLALWVDADLRAGDAWQAEIMAGDRPERSGVAAGQRRLPGVASSSWTWSCPRCVSAACGWHRCWSASACGRTSPELSDVQWLHDPARDGRAEPDAPTGVGGTSGSPRSASRCCEPLPDPAAARGRSGTGDRADGRRPGGRGPGRRGPGRLFGVPELPPGYVRPRRAGRAGRRGGRGGQRRGRRDRAGGRAGAARPGRDRQDGAGRGGGPRRGHRAPVPGRACTG